MTKISEMIVADALSGQELIEVVQDGYNRQIPVQLLRGKSAYEDAVALGFVGSKELWLESLKGVQGFQGEVGFTGPEGEIGIRGLPGPIGPIGPAGSKGLKGDQGDKGNIGLTGLQGEQGLKGLKGDKGDIGDTGQTGPVGETGAVGDKGETGAVGLTGDQGPIGKHLKVAGTLAHEDDLELLVDPLETDIYVIGSFFWGLVDEVWTNLGDFRGEDGLSAFEVAQADGYTGTLAEWFETLRGPEGIGLRILGSLAFVNDLPTGPTVQSGDAYIIGGKMHVWDTQRWSEVGQMGPAGKSAYQIAVANGFPGPLAAWLASLIGPVGPNGTPGEAGATGPTGPVGPMGMSITIIGSLANTDLLPMGGVTGDGYIIDGHFWGWTGDDYEDLGSIQGVKGDTGETGLKGDKGDPGDRGIAGATGRSAYDLAILLGNFAGTELEWLSSLRGNTGLTGLTGETGAVGQGISVLGTKNTVDDLPANPANADAWVVGTNLFVAGSEGWIDCGPFKGDVGEAGPVGPLGPRGFEGPPGEVGPMGAGLIAMGTVEDYEALLARPNPLLGQLYLIDGVGWSYDGTAWVSLGNLRGPTGRSAYDTARLADPSITSTAEFLLSLKGDIGQTGSAGPVGEAGPDGPEGPPGETGPIGPGVTILGRLTSQADLPATGTIGQGYIIELDYWGWTDSGYQNFGNFKGPKGDIGPKGDTGAQGAIGIKGDKGDQGTKWVILDRDPEAADGRIGDSFFNFISQQIFLKVSTVLWAYQGTIGIAGTQGEQGLKGDTGDKGDQGEQGIQGPIGVTGDTGAKGDPGSRGETGAQGAIGATGEVGPKGDKGDAGLNGAAGVNGTNGVDGAAGPQGTPGATGPQSLTGSFPGPVTAQNGTQRFYPRSAIVVTNVQAWLSGPAEMAVSARLKKNGAVAANIVISAGSDVSATAVNVSVATTDFLTIDVLGGSGSDLTIRLDY